MEEIAARDAGAVLREWDACPESGEADGTHSPAWYDRGGACGWCRDVAERCAECGAFKGRHHDPACSQPCDTCENWETLIRNAATFLTARLDEAERTVYAEGSPPHGVIAWLSCNRPDGSFGYTTVAHGHAADGPWFADGRELPPPASVLVVHDPLAVLRDIEADRQVLALIEWERRFPQVLGKVILIRAARFAGHPEYRAEWKP